jgi:hypothetical protein
MTHPDPDKFVSAGLDPRGAGEVFVPRSAVGDDGLVEMTHPTLPDQPIRVFPGGVAARMLAGWSPIAPEPESEPEPAAAAAAGGPPPKGGAGSGVDAWAAYAAERGVDVPDGATREQIQSLLHDAGVPQEAPPADANETGASNDTEPDEE